MPPIFASFSGRTGIMLACCIVLVQMWVLYLFGQPFFCECGEIKVWEGVVTSAGTSQQISDWYTFSHIIHGVLFYALLSFLFPRVPLGIRFAIAVGIETAWELFENTPMIIDHYRQQALARGYTGDSILNSTFDTISMMLGFQGAYRLPLWLTIAVLLVLELFVVYSIRDNLTLNIINLIHVFPAIETWQAGSLSE